MRLFVCFVLASGFVVSACASRTGQIAASDSACDRARSAAVEHELQAAGEYQAARAYRLTAEAFRAQAAVDRLAAASLIQQANAIVLHGRPGVRSAGRWSVLELSSYDQCRRAQQREHGDGLDHKLLESL